MRLFLPALGLIVAGSLVLAGAAGAAIGVPDEVPAATLLAPFFNVNLSCAPGAANTWIDIENTASVPSLVHITLWTDLSYPSLDFDLYLPANTSATFDLGAAFCNGTLPTRPADPAASSTPTALLDHSGHSLPPRCERGSHRPERDVLAKKINELWSIGGLASTSLRSAEGRRR